MLNVKEFYQVALFCTTSKAQEPIYEDDLETLISGFYRNNKVSYTIVFVRSVSKLNSTYSFSLEEVFIAPVIANAALYCTASIF